MSIFDFNRNSATKLKREKLVELTEEFIKQTDNFEIFKIPNKLYLDYFGKLETAFKEHIFENDERFVTYGRLDFLKEEVSQRLNDKKLKYEESNSVWGKNKWDNRMGAFIDLWDYIRGDRWFTPTNIPKEENFKEILSANDQYYKDGFICEQERDVLLEMINEIKKFIVTKNNEDKIVKSIDAKQLILKIINQDWGQKLISEWSTKTWYIYDDLSIIYEVTNGQEKRKTYSHCISDEDLKEIIKNIELAKTDNTVVNACDGEAWEFVQYKNNNIVWKRDLEYIYGIESLEKISYILLDLVKNDSVIFIEEESEENNMGLFSKKNKYDIEPENNRPQIVYGPPQFMIDKDKKYDVDPKDNVPREVYGIPSPLKKEIDNAKDKYDVKPEQNVPQKVYGVMNPDISFDKNDKESINIIINNYCLSLTKWSNKCDILYMDKSKENFIKDSIITVPIGKFDEFVQRLNKIIVFWNPEYSGDNGIEWKIKISTKDMNKNILGNGNYPHNWNEFIDLISEYEILFKKTIAYDKNNEEKLASNTSFEKVVEQKVKDPFFTRLICDYFKNEIKKNDTVSKLLFEDVSKYDDVFNEFTKYLIQKTYDLPNPISVEGYTAKQIAELKPDFKATGVYTFLNYLREKPEEAKDIIKKGFPNKDVITHTSNNNIKPLEFPKTEGFIREYYFDENGHERERIKPIQKPDITLPHEMEKLQKIECTCGKTFEVNWNNIPTTAKFTYARCSHCNAEQKLKNPYYQE